MDFLVIFIFLMISFQNIKKWIEIEVEVSYLYHVLLILRYCKL